MFFMHLGIPLFLLLGMWIHIQRISRARTNPPRAIMFGTLAALTVLSLVYPALSQGPADLDTVVSVVRPDWFYLTLYPLIDVWSPGAVWMVAGGGTLLLMILPWLPRRPEAAAAVVSLPNCNGCGRCFADCPYSAVIMQPRTDGLPYDSQASVDPDLCTACGICAGACPTATPFRRTTELVAGIDMPLLPVRALRQRALDVMAPLSGPDRVLVYACRGGSDPGALETAGVGVVTLPCVGALPPSFIDFAISRRHADGVMLVGCAAGDCYQRLGIDWVEQRLAGQRDPYLRGRVPRDRVITIWAGPRDGAKLARRLAAFRARLRDMGPFPRGGTPPDASASSQGEIRNVAY
jgi:ferredoxin/coenzyme F420-reducing hydrogenase delta subunit